LGSCVGFFFCFTIDFVDSPSGDEAFFEKVLSPNPERIVLRFIFLDFFWSPIFFGVIREMAPG
jgi:hypothetical protein